MQHSLNHEEQCEQTRIQKETNKVRKENKRLHNKISKLHREAHRLTAETARLTAEIERLNKQTELYKEEILDLKSMMNMFQDEAMRLEKEIKRERAIADRLAGLGDLK